MKINVITEPSVYCIGSQAVQKAELQRFRQDHGINWEPEPGASHGATLAETGGRLCYMSFNRPRPGGNAAYLKNIKAERHGSVLEHAVWTFIITGISRRCCEQLTRTRVGFSPSQLSQRYVDETEGEVLDVVLPPEYLEIYRAWDDWVRAAEPGTPAPAGSDIARDWYDSMFLSGEKYRSLAARTEALLVASEPDPKRRRKMAREAARSVLTNATETKIQITVNARTLRHLFEQRFSAGADREIHRLMVVWFREISVMQPGIFGDYEVVGTPQGLVLKTPHVKV